MEMIDRLDMGNAVLVQISEETRKVLPALVDGRIFQP